MRYMNSYDIQRATDRWCRTGHEHPVLCPATRTLVNLYDWTNEQSDGWAYWAPPVRAAKQLMELLDGDYTSDYQRELEGRPDADLAAQYRKAVVPLKAFRTKVITIPEKRRMYGHQGPMPSFDIEEPMVTRTGRVLTEADIQALADEAERGYDVTR